MKKITDLQLREKAKLNELNAIFAKHRDPATGDFNATDSETLNSIKSLNAEIEGIQAEIKTAQEMYDIELRAKTASSGHPLNNGIRFEGTEAAGGTVIAKNEKGEVSILEQEGAGLLDRKTRAEINTGAYKTAFANYIRLKGMHNLGEFDRKALQVGVDSQGGFLVPDEMLARIIQRDPAPTSIAGLVTRLTTSRDSLTIPRVNYTDTTNSANSIYTTGIRVTKTGEVPSSSTVHRVTEPAFGQIRIPVHTFMLSMPLTNDMVEDAGFPILNWASQKFSETIDLLYDNEILNGTGIGGPKGIVTSIGTGTDDVSSVVSGNSSALTADGLIDLNYSIPPQYLMNTRYVMSYRDAAKALAKLKDSQNRYLFNMGGASDGGLQGRRPDTLLGAPIVYSEFMPAIAANAYPLLFGDFTGYYHVARTGFAVQILSELYAETNQLMMLGRLRFGGQVAEPWKINAQKIST